MLCTEQALDDLTATAAELSTRPTASVTSTLSILLVIDETTLAAASSAASSASNLTLPNNVCSLMAELNLRSSKKFNIVLHGLSTGTGDEKSFVQRILVKEFHMKAMITSLSCFGKGSTRGPPSALV